MKKIGLFVPCYINQFFPKVAKDSLEILEKMEFEVIYPLGQTCCGQPLANSGYQEKSKEICSHLVGLFLDVDAIVTPSGSCAYHIRHHYDFLEQTDQVSFIRENTYELCEFLIEFTDITKLNASFGHKVSIHSSCHGLRGLQLESCSENMIPPFSKLETLLNQVEGLELIEAERKDECCGFGGTFAITEEAVSTKMGKDKLTDHLSIGSEYITATDSSCLMHLQGLIDRKKLPIRTVHIAEILNSRT